MTHNAPTSPDSFSSEGIKVMPLDRPVKPKLRVDMLKSASSRERSNSADLFLDCVHLLSDMPS